RTPLLLLDAGPALAVQLVEADGRRRVGCREDANRDVDQADLEVSLPGCSCRHRASPLRLGPGPIRRRYLLSARTPGIDTPGRSALLHIVNHHPAEQPHPDRARAVVGAEGWRLVVARRRAGRQGTQVKEEGRDLAGKPAEVLGGYPGELPMDVLTPDRLLERRHHAGEQRLVVHVDGIPPDVLQLVL